MDCVLAKFGKNDHGDTGYLPLPSLPVDNQCHDTGEWPRMMAKMRVSDRIAQTEAGESERGRTCNSACITVYMI